MHDERLQEKATATQEQGSEAHTAGLIARAEKLIADLYMAIRDLHEITASDPSVKRDAKIFASALLMSVTEFVNKLKPSSLLSVKDKVLDSFELAQRLWDAGYPKSVICDLMNRSSMVIDRLLSGERYQEDVVRDAMKQGLNVHQLAVLTGKDVGWVEEVLRAD